MMTSNMIWKFSLVVLIIYLSQTESTLDVRQPNVCQKTNTTLEEYTQSYTSTFRVKTYTWCFGVPPRCSKYKTLTRTSYKKAKRLKAFEFSVCCDGYKEVNNKCIPVCKKGCTYGLCIAPDVCDCISGRRGVSCDSKCPFGTWGDNCLQKCSCQNDGVCNVASGQCSCKPGFHGVKCQFRCPDGTFGAHCSQRCKCIHGQGKCDPVSGRCQCFPGYHGPLCEKRCTGSFGQDCESDCMCQNEGHCNPEDGSCMCQPGWSGIVCANTCQEGRFGYRCREKCHCYNGGVCNHVTGSCNCKNGYTGDRCQRQCPLGMYGPNCSLKCLCDNNARCDPVDGTCVCTKEYMGPHCLYKVCRNGWFGKGCTKNCHCNVNSSTCDPWTGQCTCNKGYVGPRCEQSCDDGWYGVNCTLKCECTGREICNYEYGCIAASVNFGQSGTYSDKTGGLIGLAAGLFLLLIILLSICLVVYYRRRYRRLKHTTELMVQYSVVTTDANNLPGGSSSSSEDGACGGDSENPAHRHLGSRKKRKEAEAMEEPLSGAGGVEGHSNAGRRYRHQDSYGVPSEPPPPYTPAPEGDGNTGSTLPPPYTANPNTAITEHDNDNITENSHLQSSSAMGYGGVNDEEDDDSVYDEGAHGRDEYHAHQNVYNEYREKTPI